MTIPAEGPYTTDHLAMVELHSRSVQARTPYELRIRGWMETQSSETLEELWFATLRDSASAMRLRRVVHLGADLAVGVMVFVYRLLDSATYWFLPLLVATMVVFTALVTGQSSGLYAGRLLAWSDVVRAYWRDARNTEQIQADRAMERQVLLSPDAMAALARQLQQAQNRLLAGRARLYRPPPEPSSTVKTKQLEPEKPAAGVMSFVELDNGPVTPTAPSQEPPSKPKPRKRARKQNP